MLHGKLALHDMEDVESCCAYLLRRRGTHIDDFEDALTWAIEKVWELSLRYDPSRGSTFVNYAARYVRVADYFRARDGRTVWKFKTHTYERPRPVFAPLDDRPELGVEDEPDELLALLGLGRDPR